MPKILITFQLLFALSSGKHILRWKVPSITLHCFFNFHKHSESWPELWVGRHPGFYYYVLLVNSEKCGLRKGESEVTTGSS